MADTAVVLANLGTPDAPTPAALRRYLGEFLADPRVVEIPRALWLPILHGLILRTRPAKSAAKYAKIWLPEGSPLLVWTQRQATALEAALRARGHAVRVWPAMRYGNPALPAALDAACASGAQRLVVLPAYPQYCSATGGSTFDAVAQWGLTQRALPALHLVQGYHDQPAHIAALAASVRAHWQAHGRPEHLVLSFHGMPERTRRLGDPYHDQCQATAALLARALDLADGQWHATFQSRFGKAKWLEPATEPTLVRMAREGVRHVGVLCPGFAVDCLETLEEIDLEARTAFLAAGGQRFDYIPCLNDRPDGIAALADLAEAHLPPPP